MKAMLVLTLLATATPGLAADIDVKTIHLQDGIHSEPLDILGDGTSRVVIVGNEEHPEKVVVDVKGSDAIRVRKAAVRISGIELRTTAAFAQLVAEDGGEIEFSHVRFGLGGKHIVAEQGGHVRATGNYDIVVGGLLHLLARGGAIELNSNIVVTVHNAVFRAYFAGASAGGSIIIDPGVSFSGLASATKFHVRDHGRIDSGGLGVAGLPGGWPGRIENSGEYDALHAESRATP